MVFFFFFLFLLVRCIARERERKTEISWAKISGGDGGSFRDSGVWFVCGFIIGRWMVIVRQLGG